MAALIMVHIYLVIFSLSRLGVRMWALFMGRWYLFPFLGVHGDGFLANGPREKHHFSRYKWVVALSIFWVPPAHTTGLAYPCSARVDCHEEELHRLGVFERCFC